MNEDLKTVPQLRDKILSEVSRVVIGKDEIKEMLLVTLLSGGHILIEGLPGTAKTTLAKTFAGVIGGEFGRIQFTPDMLPSDVTGFYLYTSDGTSKFIPGPVFANIVLADELNRTTPRTQAALLEVMQENQATIEGKTHPLSGLFMVIASQVSYGGEGTYPLTEVQADRFMLRVWSGHPAANDEEMIIGSIDHLDTSEVSPVASLEEVSQLQRAVREVHISEKIRGYIVALVGRVRLDADVLIGPSPRASISLYKGSRALALLEGRDFVLPDDVKRLFPLALQHRIRIKPEAEMEDVIPEMIIKRCLEETPVPKVEP